MTEKNNTEKKEKKKKKVNFLLSNDLPVIQVSCKQCQNSGRRPSRLNIQENLKERQKLT